ncbi:MAG: PilZ domain-containing protein [Undibacterium curvum]|uniref:PilZ domain-containing protein n=1 Tax=Undibacterium curvum TaxID=2762294 RepID=UPI003BD8328F
MVELRRAPRINVTWRCGIKLSDGRLLMCRAINISSEGILLISEEKLIPSRSYPMMVEIPGIKDPKEIFRVSCKGNVRHVVLSDGNYRAGIHLSDMSEVHKELVSAWVSMAEKKFSSG